MNRRQFLKLGAVTGGVFALGGAMWTGGRSAFAPIDCLIDRRNRVETFGL